MHIYINQIDGIKKQIDRYDQMKYYDSFIKEKSESEIINYYTSLNTQVERLKNYSENNPNDKQILEELKRISEEFKILDFMLKKEKPILELSDKDDFFEFSNEVNNDKEYLKENPTGNKDIKLLNYTSLPFIKMPIAQ